MSTRSKFFYLLFVLIFAFTSLAAGAVVGTEMAVHNVQSDTAYYSDAPLSGPSFVIAGDCDTAPACGGG